MVPVVFLSTFWDVFWALLIVLFIIIPLILLWAFALVDLFMRRDLRWGKVLWLFFIVILPILGPIIYLLVRPWGIEEQDYAARQAPAKDAGS